MVPPAILKVASEIAIAEDLDAAPCEGQHVGAGNGVALKRGAELSGRVLRYGISQKNGRFADRVDHREIDYEHVARVRSCGYYKMALVGALNLERLTFSCR